MKAPALTHERLREVLNYDPATGHFTWRVDLGRARAGRQAGCTDKRRGVVIIRIDRVFHSAHRLAWFWMTGTWPTNEIDHIDCYPSNNKFDNLREATSAQNKANCPKRTGNRSGFKGVTCHRKTGLYFARITYNGVHIYLGYFKTPEAAHAAYVNAAQKIYGEFART